MNGKPVGSAAARRAPPPRQGTRRHRGARRRATSRRRRPSPSPAESGSSARTRSCADPAAARALTRVEGTNAAGLAALASNEAPPPTRRGRRPRRRSSRRRRRRRAGPDAAALRLDHRGRGAGALAFGTIEAFNAASKRDEFNNHTGNVGRRSLPGLRHGQPVARLPAAQGRRTTRRSRCRSSASSRPGVLAAGASVLFLLSVAGSRRRRRMPAGSAQALGCVPDLGDAWPDLQPSFLNRAEISCLKRLVARVVRSWVVGARLRPAGSAARRPTADGPGGRRAGRRHRRRAAARRRPGSRRAGGGTGRRRRAAAAGGARSTPGRRHRVHGRRGLHAGEQLPRRERRPAGRAGRRPAWTPSSRRRTAPSAVRTMVCNNGSCAACAAGEQLLGDRQAVPHRNDRLHDRRAGLHRDRTTSRTEPPAAPGWSARPARASPVRRARPARRPTPVTTARSPARPGPRSAPTRGRTCRRRDDLRHEQGLQRDRRVRRLHGGRELHRLRQALPDRHDHLQHGHAGLRGVGERRGRHQLRDEHGLQRRRLRRLHGRARLHADQPLPRRVHRLLADDHLRGQRQHARQRHRLRDQQGLQQRHLRRLHGRRQLPADQPLPDRRDLVRDRRVGLRRDRKPAERHRLRDEHGLQQRRLRRLHGGRRLHADQPLSQRNARLHAPAARPAPTAARSLADGSTLRDEPGVQDGELRLLHRGADLHAEQPVQEREHVVRDRDVGLRGHQQQAGRHAVRRRAVVHGAASRPRPRCATRARPASPPRPPARAPATRPGPTATPASPARRCARAGARTSRSDPANCGDLRPRLRRSAGRRLGLGTCSGGDCDLACNAGYLQCSGNAATARSQSWDFEDGTTDGFSIVGNDQMAVTSISELDLREPRRDTTPSRSRSTSRGAVAGSRSVSGLCGGSGAVPASGRTVSAWFYLSPSLGHRPAPEPDLDASASTSPRAGATAATRPPNRHGRELVPGLHPDRQRGHAARRGSPSAGLLRHRRHDRHRLERRRLHRRHRHSVARVRRPATRSRRRSSGNRRDRGASARRPRSSSARASSGKVSSAALRPASSWPMSRTPRMAALTVGCFSTHASATSAGEAPVDAATWSTAARMLQLRSVDRLAKRSRNRSCASREPAGRRLIAAVLAREEAARERRPRRACPGRTGAAPGTCSRSSVALDQAVLRLQGDEAVRAGAVGGPQALHQTVGGVVERAEVEHLACAHQLVERAQRSPPRACATSCMWIW